MLDAYLYRPIFYNLLLILTLYLFIKYREKKGVIENQYKPQKTQAVYFLASLLILFLGFRPISGYYFGDTSNYFIVFNSMKGDIFFDWKKGDILFNGLMYFCAQIMSVEGFFTIIAGIYIGCGAKAVTRLFPQNSWIAFLMYVGAFSFFSYGTNGIRNGAAAAIFILALSYMDKKKILFILIAISLGFHKSMMLPAMAVLISLLYNNSKIYLVIWLLAIPISFIGRGFFESFFGQLGFDDRFSYLTTKADDSLFSSTGFRWDFLLYSSVPIIVGFYCILKKKTTSKFYALLLNTYIIANTFWILVIQANYSNRIAYLSWFLYPIVLLYPFVHFRIWNYQYKKIAWVLLLHFSFTYFMWIIS